MAQVLTIEEKVQIAMDRSEEALIAAARKSGRAEVSRAEFARYRIEFAFLLNERLNVNQVPVNLGDLLHRIDAIEAHGGGSDVTDLLRRVGAAEDRDVDLRERIDALESGSGPSNAQASAPVPLPPPPAPAPVKLPLALSFHSLQPSGRDYLLKFNTTRPISNGYADVRDRGFSIVGGEIVGARRQQGRSDRWQILIRPSGRSGALSVSASPFLTDCDGDGLAHYTEFVVR